MVARIALALFFAAVLLSIAYHTPAAIDHAVAVAESRAPAEQAVADPTLGHELAEEYSRQIFEDEEITKGTIR